MAMWLKAFCKKYYSASFLLFVLAFLGSDEFDFYLKLAAFNRWLELIKGDFDKYLKSDDKEHPMTRPEEHKKAILLLSEVKMRMTVALCGENALVVKIVGGLKWRLGAVLLLQEEAGGDILGRKRSLGGAFYLYKTP